MRKSTLLLSLFILLCQYGFSQIDSIPQNIPLSLTAKDESEFKLHLMNLERIIAIHLYVTPFPDNGWQHSDRTFMEGTFLETQSGIHWRIGNELPKKPAMYTIKALSKKGRNKPDVKARLEYHQLVYEMNKGDGIRSVSVNTIRTDSATMKDYYTWIIFNADSTGIELTNKYYRLKVPN